MKSSKFLFSNLAVVFAFAFALMLAGCSSSDDAVPVAGPAATFVGSDQCQTCHPTIYSSFIESGHNFKLNKIEGAQEPTYPVFTPGISGALALITDDDVESGDPKTGTDNTLGTPASYADVSYVIGGYNWKARFIDLDGYIVTGTEVQYNLATAAMGGYHNNETDKPYNCGNCHTTGWMHVDATLNPTGQDGLAGMDGTWDQEGVQCESCHGAGSNHVQSQSAADITRVATARTTADFLASDMASTKAVACSECHTRDGEKDYPSFVSAFTTASGLDVPGGRIAAGSNLVRHHEQYDELLGVDPADPASGSTRSSAFNTSKLNCTGCHDPHMTSVYDSDSDGNLDGVDNSNAACLACHAAATYDPANGSVPGMAALNCIDCHMPFMAKSAVSTAAVGTGPVTGDIRSHIFRIDMTQTDQFTSDGKFANPYLTKTFACLTCHNGVDEFDHSTIDETNFVFHQAPAATASYVGSHHCETCHPTIYNSFIESGHNFKLNKIVGGVEPTYPTFTPGISPALAMITDDDTDSADPNEGTDNTSWLAADPAGYGDVSYVIGGYNWKARFVDLAGYIVTGTEVQYNLATGAMGGYHDNEVDKPYNCGNCHTTGWVHFDAANNPNRQDGLAGMDGTWFEEGIQCESCHGPGSLHEVSMDPADITRIARPRTTDNFLSAGLGAGLPVACSECHTRDGEKDYPSYVSAFTTASGLDVPGGRIAAGSNLIRHHEQFDELLGVDPDAPAGGSTRSADFITAKASCFGCHDPHMTSVYDSDTDGNLDGVDNSNAGCLTAGCHDAATYDPANANTVGMTGLNCIECHMPFLAKSAVSTAAEGTGPITGDIKSHIFRIDLAQTDQFTSDGSFAYPYLTKAFACLTCHNGVTASDRSAIDDSAYDFHPAAP